MTVFIQTTGAEWFYRCGTKFSKEGNVFDAERFTEEQVDRLLNEKNLHIREATDAEIKTAAASEEAAAEVELSDEKLVADLADHIAKMDVEAFQTASGAPTTKSILATWPGEPKLIDAKLRDEAWRKLIEGGFEVPKVLKE